MTTTEDQSPLQLMKRRERLKSKIAELAAELKHIEETLRAELDK